MHCATEGARRFLNEMIPSFYRAEMCNTVCLFSTGATTSSGGELPLGRTRVTPLDDKLTWSPAETASTCDAVSLTTRLLTTLAAPPEDAATSCASCNIQNKTQRKQTKVVCKYHRDKGKRDGKRGKREGEAERGRGRERERERENVSLYNSDEKRSSIFFEGSIC